MTDKRQKKNKIQIWKIFLGSNRKPSKVKNSQHQTRNLLGKGNQHQTGLIKMTFDRWVDDEVFMTLQWPPRPWQFLLVRNEEIVEGEGSKTKQRIWFAWLLRDLQPLQQYQLNVDPQLLTHTNCNSGKIFIKAILNFFGYFTISWKKMISAYLFPTMV